MSPGSIRALRASAFLIQHGFVAAVNILVFAALHWLLDRVGHITLFGRVPLSYLFDAVDLLILIVFGIYGTIEARDVLRGETHDVTEAGVEAGTHGTPTGTDASSPGSLG